MLSASAGRRVSRMPELGWSPRYTDFRDGLAATIEWYRANREWWEPVKSAIEAAYAAKGQ